MTSHNAVGIIMYGTFNTNMFGDVENTSDASDASSFRFVWMLLQVIRKRDGRAMNQLLAMFTDSPEPVFNPLLTEVSYIDAITKEGEIVTLQDGSDVMVLQLPKEMCTKGEDEEKHVDDWRRIRDNLWTSYPAPLNVTICDKLGWETSEFCRTLLSHKLSMLDNDDSNFCIRFSHTGTKRRCKSFMRVIEATGTFASKSLLGNKYPRDMHNVEWVEGHRVFDIIYPCFTSLME